MERLTNKREADAQREEYERRLANGYPRNIQEERFLRLAAYEDTGLMPDEVNDAVVGSKLLAKSQLVSAFGVAAERLCELAEADKAGRVVVLPVRPVLTQSIGSMLYIIEEGEIVEDSLCEALVGMGSNGEINIFYTTLSDQISFEQADIGKTVFLTREEAEKTLEAMKKGETEHV